MIADHYAGSHAILDLAALRRFLAELRRSLGVRGAVGVRFMNAVAIQRLNHEFRGHDAPTDVLSFPAGGLERGYLGDLAISLDAAAAQARARRHSLEAEVRILMIHGVLHLLGCDHEHDDGAMRRRERELRRAFGLPPGLIERATGRRIKAVWPLA